LNDTNTFRVAYTYDRAHHRQTGEYSFTDANFNIDQPFFGRNGKPLLSAAGTVLQNRDRTSIALLNQLSGQYIGRFFDNRLRLELGLRSPWFKRDLDQHCYTPLTGAGFPVCIVNPLALGYRIVPNDADPATAGSKDLYAPFKAKYKYHKLLPNIGATFAINQSLSAFASYSKGFSAPRTDNLYRAPFIGVQPESTDSFDLGARYITSRFQAQATLWKIDYKNRIVTSFDPETNTSIDRNVGKANSWGVDTGVGFRPIRALNLIGLLSYTNAKLKDDITIGTVTYNVAAPPTTLTPFQFFCSPLPTSGSATVQVCGHTSGKFVVERFPK
jgi:iron complex outermembrane receptor protein